MQEAYLRYRAIEDIPTTLRPYADVVGWAADGVTPVEWAVTVVPKSVVAEYNKNQEVVMEALVAALRAKA